MYQGGRLGVEIQIYLGGDFAFAAYLEEWHRRGDGYVSRPKGVVGFARGREELGRLTPLGVGSPKLVRGTGIAMERQSATERAPYFDRVSRHEH